MTDDALTENAKKILKERYLKRDKEGNIVESEDEMFKRVARAIAEINKEYDDDRSFGDEKDEFYEALTNLDFVPNSPTLMNAGLELGQLSACFVLSPLDDMDSIFQQVKNAAKIFQSGGGVGYSFSRLRPRGDTVKSTGGIASGPVSFMRVYDEMCNTIKQGGCLASDERVMTTNGYIPIREIHNGRPNSDAPSKALVKTREGFNQVIQTNDSGEMDVHTIKTEDGYNIRAVYEHPLLSVNNEGKLEFKRVDELTEGDIIVFDQSDKLVDKRQDLKEVDKKYHHNVQIADNLPYKVTDDLAIFLGLLWADGTFDSSNDRLVFSLAKDRSEKDWLVKTVSSWGLNVRVIDQKEKGKGDYWRVVIQSQHLMDWMRKNRLAKDITKIPEAIYRSPIAIPAFLGGFTADANIAKDANTVCYSTANKRTAENLQELLLLCGISSKIMRTESQDNRYSDKERFEVRVNPGRSAKLYEQKVPHFLNGKVGGAGGQRQNKVYFADKLVNSLLDENFIKNNKLPELPEDVDRKAMKELRRYERGEKIPSRKRLVDVLERIGITDVPELSKNNLFQMITYNEEDSRAGVADIEVMHSSHNYIAGNAVVHNKRRGAQMGILSVEHPDIEEFITAKDEEESLNNFNISVGLTEDFMEAVKRDEEYDIINPRTDEVVGKKDALEIYKKIVHQAWKNGEPGIIFLDRINEDNPFDVEKYPSHYIDATNPCVTGDTLISTKDGLFKAEELCENGADLDIIIDGRLSDNRIKEASNVFKTGEKDVYRLKTKEGYEIRLTKDHKMMTDEGWKEVQDIESEDEVHIVNNEIDFGEDGSFEEGLVLGWIVGDGQIKKSEERVTLHFYDKDTEISKKYAGYVNQIIREAEGNGDYEVGVQDIKRDEESVKEQGIRSERLYEITERYGLNENKLQVPDKLLSASKDTAKGFLKGLFTADGSVQGSNEKGVSVRLSNSELNLLKEVQQLLLGFGISSKIYEERREEGEHELPDSNGGTKKYKIRSQHELVISKENLHKFKEEIGFIREDKNEKLEELLNGYSKGPYSEKFKATVESIEYDGHEDVYDLTEPDTHSFVGNGFVIHNCGEQPLEDYEACNLGHINLSHCVEDGEIDWDKLEKLTDMGVRFLDNVIDASEFPDVEGYEGEGDAIRRNVEANRKIGLGVMGWHHMLMKLGIPYDNNKAIEKAKEVMKFIDEKSKETSRKIAEERGRFPNWDESTYEEPMRNATTTTIAPTGTTSMIADTSGGIEPIFAVSYVKNVLDGEQLVMPDSVFAEIAEEGGFYSEELMKNIADQGTVTDIDEVPDDIKPLFKTALEIKPEWHIRMQGAFQDYVDNAISKTVNFPNDALEEDIREVYNLAYDLKCKGVTVYRSGSRQEQVMEVEGEKKKDEEETKKKPRKRPTTVTGTTRKINTGYGGLYVTINEDEHGLFEVFAQIGRAGGFTQSFTESLARLISLGLRSGIEVNDIINQLEGIRSPEIAFDQGTKILSIPDAMAKALKWHLQGRPRGEQATLPTDEAKKVENGSAARELVSKGLNPACPECGAMLTIQEGCRKCPNCGYSQC